MSQVVQFTQDIVRNISPADLAIGAGLVTSGVHGLLKKYKNLSKVTNIITSFVLPLVGAVLTAVIADKSAFLAYPAVYAAAQSAYYIFNGIKTGAEWLQLGKTVSGAQTQATTVQPDNNF